MEISNLPIDDVIPYARNPRLNDAAVAKVAASIQEFGWRQPIVVDDDRVVIVGHTRLLAARQLGLKEVPTHTAAGLTPAQVKAYRLADNRTGEDAQWDAELLSLELDDLDGEIDFDVLGFEDDELTKYRADKGTDGLTDEDEVPEVPDEPVTVLGDVWLMGGHRLMCGDSTSIDAVEKLMDGQKADMVFTDPPYGMFLDTNYDSMFSKDDAHRKTGERFDDVKGDHDDFNPDFINTIFTAFDYCKEIFLWGADYYVDLIPSRNSGSWVVWDKRCDENMDKVVGNTFELCWSKAKHKRMVARILWSGHHGMQKDDAKKRIHPTQKPVELVVWFFDYYSMQDKVVIADLFGGSGSTMIACEKTSRSCRMMELDPKYCDVIINRWQDFTGKEATLESTGQTFTEVSNGRTQTNTDSVKANTG